MPSPFSFFLSVADFFLLSPYSLQLTDTTKGIVLDSADGNYALGADSYSLNFVAAYDLGSGASINTTAPRASPVSEPATYPLMLAGLGLMAGLLRRRQAAQPWPALGSGIDRLARPYCTSAA